MTNRDWLCLGLRLLGIWMLVQAVEGIIPYLLYIFIQDSRAGGIQMIAYSIVLLTCRTTLAMILVLFAPAIAARFYRSVDRIETTDVEINEVKALRIGVQLLAVCALLLAIQSGAKVLYRLLASGNFLEFNYLEETYLQSLMNCGLNLTFAAILLMWNEQVITLIAKWRYVPERDAYEPPPIEEK